MCVYLFFEQATPDNVIADAQLLPYPYPERRDAPLTSKSLSGGGGGFLGGPTPLSMAMTEFHFLLLYPDRLEVVSRLNGTTVQVRRIIGGCSETF